MDFRDKEITCEYKSNNTKVDGGDQLRQYEKLAEFFSFDKSKQPQERLIDNSIIRDRFFNNLHPGEKINSILGNYHAFSGAEEFTFPEDILSVYGDHIMSDAFMGYISLDKAYSLNRQQVCLMFGSIIFLDGDVDESNIREELLIHLNNLLFSKIGSYVLHYRNSLYNSLYKLEDERLSGYLQKLTNIVKYCYNQSQPTVSKDKCFVHYPLFGGLIKEEKDHVCDGIYMYSVQIKAISTFIQDIDVDKVRNKLAKHAVSAIYGGVKKMLLDARKYFNTYLFDQGIAYPENIEWIIRKLN